MSGLTVKQCFEMFPSMKARDMKLIIGKSNFLDTDLISSDAIARYQGRFSQPLSIFYAQHDTNNFLPLLKGKRQYRIMKAAGINKTEQKEINKQEEQQNQENIDMDTSVFDIDEKRRKRNAVQT